MARIPEIDLSECIKCDACAEICPDVFRRNDADYFEVLDLPLYPEECVEEAVKYCPAQCITWQESE